MASAEQMGGGFIGGPFQGGKDVLAEGFDVQITDADYVLFGDLDGGDFKMGFDGTNLELLPGVDDTGAFNIGDGTTDADVKVFLGTTAKYVLFDVGNVLLQLEDVDLRLGDNDILQFGDATGGDVRVKWDATNLTVLPAADDTGAINIGDGTTDMDLKIFLSASTKYVLCDVGNALLTLEDVDLRLGDNDVLEFGDAAGGDVRFKWDATNLTILPAVDDTGSVVVGDGTTDMDVKVFLGTATSYVLFDVGGVLLTLEDVDLHLGDNDEVQFGDAVGGDVSVVWNASALAILPAANDTGAINVGDGTTDIDVKVFLGATTKYVLHDVGNSLLQLEDVDLLLGDNDEIQFGDAAGGDVSITWNATNLVILPAVDDTGAIYVGDGTTDIDLRIHQGTATDYVEFDVGAKALEVVGETRIDLSAATIAAANTDGGVIKAGTSGAPVTEDTAGMKFCSLYFDCGATSGESVALYERLYVTGEAGEGIALRSFCTVSDVAATNARGGHISLSVGTSGTVTGLGTALETTLHIGATSVYSGGTFSSIKAAINSDGAASDPAGMTALSVFNVVSQGDGTGMADVDTDCVLFDIDGFASGSGNMVYTNTSTPGDSAGSIKINIGGTPYYLRYWAAQA